MMVGRVVRLSLVVGLFAVGRAWATDPAVGSMSAEVRVLSGAAGPTVVTLQATPDAHVDDRTPGAHPASDAQGPASVGETFTDEITFVVAGVSLSHEAAIEVADALVSTVRLFPERGGTRVVVFVRQPVSYTIARPTATGAIALTLRPRTALLAAAAAAAHPGGRKPPHVPTDATGQEVAVDASELQYDQDANVLVARGGVTLTRGTTTVRADEVRYDRTNAVAEAHGHVVVVDPEAKIEGDSARLDLDDETGWIDSAVGDMKRSPYRLNADHVQKKGGPCYRIENGIFTTCRCGGVEAPSWSIAGKETDVTVGGVGITKGATFRVLDVPALYLPYLIFPANTERQSGFLVPRVGYSNRRGALYEQPFFWAIDKSSDATIALDIESNARIGAIGEYRYQWSKQAHGIFTAAYFNESIGGQPETLIPIVPGTIDRPTDRWVVAGHHSQPFLWDTKLYLDVLRVSDDQFFREIRAFSSTVRGDIQVRSTRLTRSRLGVLKTWDEGAAQFEATSYQDLIDPQELALDRLPRLAAEHTIPFLGGHVLGRLAGEAVDFQRTEGFDGLRLDLAPELLVPFNAGRYLFGSVRGQARETAYHLTSGEQVGRFIPDDPNQAARFAVAKDVLADLNSNHTREIGQVSGQLGSELSRVYDFPHLGFEKIRHTIEPEVQYLFVPQVGRDISAVRSTVGGTAGTLFTDGYLFDEVDAINRRNFISYGVTTRIFARGPSVAAPAPAPAATSAHTAAAPAPAAVADTVADDDEETDDEDDTGDALGNVDADAIPQGLSAVTLPSAPGPAPTGKGAPVVPMSQELLRATVLHGYDISRKLAGRSHVSDVDFQLRLTPVSFAGFTYNTSVDVQGGRQLAQSAGLVLHEPNWQPPPGRTSFQAPSSLGVAYRFVADNLNSGLGTATAEQRLFNNASPVEGIDGAAYLRFGDYMGFLFLARYDLSTTQAPDPDHPLRTRILPPHFLERDYIMRVMSRCDCWLLEFGVTDRSDTNDTTFRVQFTLYGLGSIGQGPATRGYAGLTGLQSLGFRRPVVTGRGDY